MARAMDKKLRKRVAISRTCTCKRGFKGSGSWPEGCQVGC